MTEAPAEIRPCCLDLVQDLGDPLGSETVGGS